MKEFAIRCAAACPPAAIKLAKWMAYLGLACGVVYSVGGLVIDMRTTGVNGGTAMAFMALVGMPAVFGAFGFLLGAVGALVFRIGRGK